ncbi:hypothetical protein HZS61_008563 [Fusarium oxysporum f. sp. conglutinans]|uniref:Uncharacterized protein n=1 Tax=Fusarium oxysporum f. sp. conglutinans TaxID=100902 RepID=A0A8H6H2S9_FUSOX|nr:hypothetical protein HZS61_008563 [Fusarium oxysporum f. sp. conglutinans]KAG7000189.1 hypothetical protein FocnCong_v012603 [Fusarium oxysporum f. sp. conglutinans]
MLAVRMPMTLQRWFETLGKLRSRWMDPPSWMGWSKNGRIIQCFDSQTLSWDVRTKHVTYDPIPILDLVRGLAIYGRGATLFTLGPNNTVQQFDLNSPAIMAANVLHPANLLPPSPPVSKGTGDQSATSTTTIASESETSSISLDLNISERDEDHVSPFSQLTRHQSCGSDIEPYESSSPGLSRSGLSFIVEVLAVSSQTPGRCSDCRQLSTVMLMGTQEIWTPTPWDTLLALQVFLPWLQAVREEGLLACAMKLPGAPTITKHSEGSASRVLFIKWLGDIDADIMNANFENMTSSDWMLLALNGISAHASQQKLGHIYVQRLLEAGDVHAAVTIMLGIGDDNDAIKEFTESWTFTSAAKLNFQAMTPSIPEVLSSPLSPLGVQCVPQRSIAKTSALKLMTSFGDQTQKSKFFAGDGSQSPIAAIVTPIADSAGSLTLSRASNNEATTAFLRH